MKRIENLMDLENVHVGEMIQITDREEQVSNLVGSCLRTLSKNGNEIVEIRYIIGKDKIKNQELLMKISKEDNPTAYNFYNDLMEKESKKYDRRNLEAQK